MKLRLLYIKFLTTFWKVVWNVRSASVRNYDFSWLEVKTWSTNPQTMSAIPFMGSAFLPTQSSSIEFATPN